jgi:predicted Abi (CAAX) family protease
MKLILGPLLPALALATNGCLPKRNTAAVQSSVSDAKSFFRPVARGTQWSGQILLPARDSRLDGTVFVKVATAPEAYKNLTGKLIRLSWPRGSGSATQYTPNVTFKPDELAEANKASNVVPIVLNGWEQVSPLESLAAARCRGDFSTETFNNNRLKVCNYSRIERIFVTFTPTLVDAGTTTVRIGEEPTVVAGTHYTLAREIAKTSRTTGNGSLKIYQASPFQKGQFIASKIEFGVEENFGRRPNFTFNNINRSPAASEGWYLYADEETDNERSTSHFVVHAIEPRALVRVNGSYGNITGTDNGKAFLTYQENVPPANSYLAKNGLTRGAFASLENRFRKVIIRPGASRAPLSDATPIEPLTFDNSQRTFRNGEVGLVTHLFHWISDSAGKKNVGPLGLVTGHYSYGFYEVFREPIANELQFDVVYRQVYGQGGDAVISAKVTRSEYMGNLRRGWSNSIATSDVLVRAPWLDNELVASSGGAGSHVVPMAIFDDTLSLMLHAYRTGSGDGISSIVPWASCVQDSSQALFIALNRLEKTLVSSHGAGYCTNPEFGRVCGLAAKLKRQFDASDIFSNTAVRGDWLNNASSLQISRSENQMENGYEALASYKTALPRNAFNLFLSAMLEQGANLVLMDNVQIGGFWTPEQRAAMFLPVPATTIIEPAKALLAASGLPSQNLTTQQFVDFLLKHEGVRSLSDLNHRYPNR